MRVSAGEDAFVLASFLDPSAGEWRSEEGKKWEETQYRFASISHYENGSLAPRGVGFDVLGSWNRVESNDWMTFHGASETSAIRDEDPVKELDIDPDELSVRERYRNAAGGETKYSLTIRRSTGRFTESYAIAPRYGEPELLKNYGRCLIYSKGRTVSSSTRR